MDTLSNLFKSDADKALNGVPIAVGYNKNAEEVIFWIAEAGNRNHVKVQRKYAKQLEANRRNSKKIDKILINIIAEALLVHWENVLDSDGSVVEPTIENKVEALTKYKKLYHRVLDESSDADNFRLDDPEDDSEDDLTPEEIMEDTEGNLKAS
jgi:hypothetical protein